jgi:hypothetical protein
MEAAGRGWSRNVKVAFGDLESRFSPERRVFSLVRSLAAPNGTTAPGQLRAFDFLCEWPLERQL